MCTTKLFPSNIPTKYQRLIGMPGKLSHFSRFILSKCIFIIRKIFRSSFDKNNKICLGDLFKFDSYSFELSSGSIIKFTNRLFYRERRRRRKISQSNSTKIDTKNLLSSQNIQYFAFFSSMKAHQTTLFYYPDVIRVYDYIFL